MVSVCALLTKDIMQCAAPCFGYYASSVEGNEPGLFLNLKNVTAGVSDVFDETCLAGGNVIRSLQGATLKKNASWL